MKASRPFTSIAIASRNASKKSTVSKAGWCAKNA